MSPFKSFFGVLLFSFLLMNKIDAQPCSVVLSASDTLICSGESITLNAVTNGVEAQLQASNTAGNNHRGNMFDIVATNTVTILSFDAYPMGNTTIEVYYKTGTWNGFANTPSAWTFIGSAPVTYTGGFSPVAVNVNVTIPAGETYAFYVTSNNISVSLNYSNGTNVGNVYSSDANIAFIEGGGLDYPFTQGTGAVYQPRVWNGMIHYALANQPGTTLTWGSGETTSPIFASPATTTRYTASASIPGCPATAYDTLNVVVSIPVVGIGNVTSPVCAGTEINLYGTGAATYVWDNGVTDSMAFLIDTTMTYSVVGTDSAGCTGSDTITITVNQNPDVSAGPDVNVCEGSFVTLAGQGASSYVWNNGVTDNVPFEPANSDTYIVTGTDANGCSKEDTVTVTFITAPDVYAGSDVDICRGEELTLSGSGATTYSWNNGVMNGEPFIANASGVYTVTGADTNGCTATDDVMVTVHSVMASVFSMENTLSTGTLVDVTIQWINCSDMSPIPGETDAIFVAQQAGSYAAIIQDNNFGCTDTSNCIQVDFAGVDNLKQDATLTAYPVPSNGKVTINSNGAIIDRMELIDILGTVLETSEPNAFQATVDLSVYAPSIFFVRLYRGDIVTLLRVVKD